MAQTTASTPTPVSLGQLDKLKTAFQGAVTPGNDGACSLSTNLAAQLNMDLYADISLTSAQILAINSTPVTFLTAPLAIQTVGNPFTPATATYGIVVDRAVLYSPGGTGYSAVGLTLNLGSNVQATFGTAALTTTTASLHVANLASNAVVTPNTALTITAGSNPTTGNFGVSIRVFFSLVPNTF